MGLVFVFKATLQQNNDALRASPAWTDGTSTECWFSSTWAQSMFGQCQETTSSLSDAHRPSLSSVFRIAPCWGFCLSKDSHYENEVSWKNPALRGSQLLRDNIKANRWQSSQSYEGPAPSSARGAEPREVPVPWGQLTKWDPVTPKFTQPSPVSLLCFVLFVIQSVIAVLWLWSMGEVLALFNWGRNIHLSLMCIDSVKDSRIRGGGG